MTTYRYRKMLGHELLKGGEELINVRPMPVEMYDGEDVGPMFLAESPGIEGTFHLFGDEIEKAN